MLIRFVRWRRFRQACVSLTPKEPHPRAMDAVAVGGMGLLSARLAGSAGRIAPSPGGPALRGEADHHRLMALVPAGSEPAIGS